MLASWGECFEVVEHFDLCILEVLGDDEPFFVGQRVVKGKFFGLTGCGWLIFVHNVVVRNAIGLHVNGLIAYFDDNIVGTS